MLLIGNTEREEQAMLTEQTRDPVHRARYAFEPRGEDLYVETWLEPGGGLPEHLHPRQEERWAVVEGRVSFRLAGVTCAFSALSYSELASSIPVSGSAYTYAYATMGELLAWIIGWDLILEYGVSVAAVAVGWAVPQLPAGRCSGGGCRTRSASRRETAGSSTFRPRSWCSRSPGC